MQVIPIDSKPSTKNGHASVAPDGISYRVTGATWGCSAHTNAASVAHRLRRVGDRDEEMHDRRRPGPDHQRSDGEAEVQREALRREARKRRGTYAPSVARDRAGLTARSCIATRWARAAPRSSRLTRGLAQVMPPTASPGWVPPYACKERAGCGRPRGTRNSRGITTKGCASRKRPPASLEEAQQQAKPSTSRQATIK